MKTPYVYLRGDSYWMRKRVPSRYAQYEDRAMVHISMHTDSLTVAQEKAREIWSQLELSWEAKMAGDTHDAEIRYQAARDLAAARSLRYRPVQRVATLPLEQIAERMDQVPMPAKSVPLEAEAFLGGAKPPPMTISRALDEFWDLADDRTFGMSADQRRRWVNPRKRAVANFIEAVGDIELQDLDADALLDYRQWWLTRIREGDAKPETANKDFSHLFGVVKTVNQLKRLGLKLDTAGMSFRTGRKPDALPLPVQWIKDVILPTGPNSPLAKLNDEAADILRAMVETGARPSEIAGLQQEHIILEADVPHVAIRDVGRRLKNKTSHRDIPLVGASLEAMQRNPAGFPRYRFKDAFSDAANKYLRDNELFPEGARYTLYGIRHSFEDRLLKAGVDERVRRDLMGHSLDGRQRYGDGGGLELRRDALNLIAL